MSAPSRESARRRASTQQTARAFIDGLGALCIELGERHGRRAAELSREHDLKGKDALHLAASLEAGCTTLFSCDAGLLKVDGKIDGIRVVAPDWARPQLNYSPDE